MNVMTPPMTDGATPTTILVVDDIPANLAIATDVLQPRYRTLVATSGRQALDLMMGPSRPDLVLLDVMLPDFDGHEVLSRMRTQPNLAEIPVIFVTALSSSEAELRGLSGGAVDFITKPIDPAVLEARVALQLELKQARQRLKAQNDWLEAEVARRVSEKIAIQHVAVRALACLAETRDPETGNHILRTQGYVAILAKRLQSHPRFKAALDDQSIEQLVESAPLHDIGKVGIPDAILNKPGPLDPPEWEVMKTHAILGANSITAAERGLERPLEFLSIAKEIAHWHHERWDGTGYPDGLAGDQIPVSARIMAVADVFDALISRRCYKPPMPVDDARRIMRDGRGKHFDPDIIDAFEEAFPDILDIATRYVEA
jgi:putative two-component system response regulator